MLWGVGAQFPATYARVVWPGIRGRTLARIRQIIESVVHRLPHDFRLEQERPHTITGPPSSTDKKNKKHGKGGKGRRK